MRLTALGRAQCTAAGVGRESVRPWTIYAIDVLARREQIPPSMLVDRVLTAYARRQRDKIPAAPRGVEGPGNGR